MKQFLSLLLGVLAAVLSAVTTAQTPQLSSQQLSIWNSDAFQRQFMQSFIAETEIEPRITQGERVTLEKFEKLMAANKVDEAVKLLTKHRTPASSAAIDFYLANVHYTQEALDEAATDYQAAIRKHEKFRRAWRNLSLIYVRQNRFDEALPALTRVIELGGRDALTYGLLGFACANQENHLAAESAFRMANLLDPTTIDWKMGLARSFFRQNRFDDAVALLGSLIAATPENADLWLLQANAFLGLGKPMRAAENYEIVDRLGKSTAESLDTLGDIYVNEELFGVATDTYLRALAMDAQASPQRALRAARVMMVRGADGDTKRLIAAIEQTHGQTLSDTDRKDLLKLRARIAVAEGDGDDEARVLEEIVRLDPLDGEALILLGQHSLRADNTEKGVFYFERAAAIEAFEADAKVRHAQLLVREGKYADALQLLRRAQQVKPRENVQEYLEQVERVSRGR